MCSLTHVQLSVTVACLSIGFSQQGYCSGLAFPPLGDLPDPGIEPVSPASLALAGGFFTTEPTWEAQPPPGTSLNQLQRNQHCKAI